MMSEGESNQQSCEGLTDRITEQRAWGDVMGRDHKINMIGLNLHHLYVSKQVPSKLHYSKSRQTLSRNST